MNDPDAELPELLPDETVQEKLEEAYSAAVEISCELEEVSPIASEPNITEEEAVSEENYISLDQSAIQQLKIDFKKSLSEFDAVNVALTHRSFNP